jgi:hypothetical protein
MGGWWPEDELKFEKLKEQSPLDAPRAAEAYKTQAPGASMTVGTPETLKYGAVEAPTLDLKNRPYVSNRAEDGNWYNSTVRSMGFTDDQGRNVLVPSVSDDGRIMDDKEAWDEYLKTGRHMGVYPTAEQSDRAGEKIHEDQEKNPPRATMHTIQMPVQEIVARMAFPGKKSK